MICESQYGMAFADTRINVGEFSEQELALQNQRLLVFLIKMNLPENDMDIKTFVYNLLIVAYLRQVCIIRIENQFQTIIFHQMFTIGQCPLRFLNPQFMLEDRRFDSVGRMVQYTGLTTEKPTLETYMFMLTDVTPINLIKKSIPGTTDINEYSLGCSPKHC